jgi:5,10-methylene-tetrahydrofolate dehydrogenase/methenyl tetrahydrofolate cyclohydrolase
MPALILDGNKIASEIRAEVASAVRAMATAGMRPGLAVVLAGHNPGAMAAMNSALEVRSTPRRRASQPKNCFT